MRGAREGCAAAATTEEAGAAMIIMSLSPCTCIRRHDPCTRIRHHVHAHAYAVKFMHTHTPSCSYTRIRRHVHAHACAIMVLRGVAVTVVEHTCLVSLTLFHSLFHTCLVSLTLFHSLALQLFYIDIACSTLSHMSRSFTQM